MLRTGITRFPSTDFKTSNYCIAYLDILGAKNSIRNDKDFKFLNHLNMFMEDAISETKGMSKFEDEVFIKIFSDNILLAVEIKDNDKEKMYKIELIFNLVANIYNEVFRYGYFMRGAIFEGEFYHNDTIVYGKGLVEVVNLEETEAVYPRLLVKKELSKSLPQYLIQDRDGWSILNIFQFSEYFDYISFKIKLLEMLKDYKDNDHIKAKIMWMINYFNFWFTRPESRILERPQITNKETAKALK